MKFFRSLFIHAKSSYSIASFVDIKRVIYLDSDKSTVFAGSQARYLRLTKQPVHTPIYDWLAEQIFNYINDGKTETMGSFDEWHKNTCNEFINMCARADRTIKYGIAQKFVNLTLKYLYCFDDAHLVEHLGKFKYCHLILDGITYYSLQERYYRTMTYGSYTFNTPFYFRDVLKTPIIELSPWTNLNYNQYMDIQTNTRRHLLTNPLTYGDIIFLDTMRLSSKHPADELTPFEIEFLLW